MHTFEITILRKTNHGWPVVVERSRPDVFLPMRLILLDADDLWIHARIASWERGSPAGLMKVFHGADLA